MTATTGADGPPAYALDTAGIARAFSRVAAGYDASAVLQRRVREELLERLTLVKLQPATVLDLGCGTGAGTRALRERYAPAAPWHQRLRRWLMPRSLRSTTLIGLDLAPGMIAACQQHQHASTGDRQSIRWVCADARQLPLPAASVDLVFSNLLLPWVADLDAVFTEVRRVLRPGGLFAFATVGPDTLLELRQATAAAEIKTTTETRATARVHEFTDMPELARGLQQAGFADPVLDRDLHRLSYSGSAALFADLRAVGATNRHAARPRGLAGRHWFTRFQTACEALRQADGRMLITCEVVYGHAWTPSGTVSRGKRGGVPQEFTVPLTQLTSRRRDER